jgi:hypothetical protein
LAPLLLLLISLLLATVFPQIMMVLPLLASLDVSVVFVSLSALLML